MIFDANKPIDKRKAVDRFNALIDKKCVFELTEKKPKRTYKQNRYLHLILSWFGVELGYTLAESKEIYKRLNKDHYQYIKNDLKFVKSSSILDTKELTITIDKFRNYSVTKAGIYLPSPDEIEYLNQIEYEIKQKQEYL